MTPFWNPLLRFIGRKVIPDYMGHWYISTASDGSRSIACRRIQIGYRLAKTWEDENVTQVEHFLAGYRR